MRATEAAHAIQAGLGERQGVAGHDFQTRAGVGAGKLTIAFVGGVGDRWELMPVGTPIADVARAERHARPGTVAIAEPAWLLDRGPLCGAAAGRRPLRADRGAPPRSGRCPPRRSWRPIPATSCSPPFVPLPVRRRQSTAGTEWMQEIRRVTVVMASLSVAGSADAGVELAHLGVQAFQRVMARFEGAAKVLVDNKGVTLSGAFGLPPRAHADDARRAITAAETLRRELEDIGLSCTDRGGDRARLLRGLRQRPAPRVHPARRGGQPRLAPDGGQRRRDPLLRRHRAGGARERRLRGPGAGHAERARRSGRRCTAPRGRAAPTALASRGWSGASSSRRRSGHGSTTW